ncbi:hypothetical protein [Cellulomonas soli]|uniref:Uncharacterized protein n=1 Tax=Cellulomonas soli TaxID=931535 RepID=A0A512PG16_9CELL|nr:hypothetical protein [Cellulomonas soli]NYI58010.1 hypothetical protein [Cellulomonas soli]GEP70145.1 hypothetical protein CSO01_28600 [Cellulomonas soli]
MTVNDTGGPQVEVGRHAPPELAELFDECVTLGYWPGEEFNVRGMPGGSSGDVIGIRLDGNSYVIWSEDNGRPHELLRTDDFDRARAYFLTEVGWHAGSRGHGPYAGRSRADEEGWTSMTPRERTIRFYEELGLPLPPALSEASEDRPGHADD